MAPPPAPTTVVQKKPSAPGSETDSNAVVDVLENTLWSRTLGQMSEEIVAALVCQIFEGKDFLSVQSASRRLHIHSFSVFKHSIDLCLPVQSKHIDIQGVHPGERYCGCFECWMLR
jgi:hypothetical protein